METIFEVGAGRTTRPNPRKWKGKRNKDWNGDRDEIERPRTSTERVYQREAADSEDSVSSTSSDVFETDIDPMNTSVIVVSNVLPLDIVFDEESMTWSAEWSNDVDGLGWSGNSSWEAGGFRRVIHVGVPNVYVPAKYRDDLEQLLNHFDCVPVYLEAQEAHDHYQGWCKAVIWPVFHNIIDLYNASKVKTRSSSASDGHVPSMLTSGSKFEQEHATGGDPGTRGEFSSTQEDKRSEWVPQKSWHPFMQEQAWPAHKAVTAKFARVVFQSFADGDTIWIQDYHLLLLPSFLARKIPRANIGIFLHVPFPSSEIFRTLSFREEILRSMLCSDHVGFHQFEYARMLGLSFETKAGGSICIPFNGRNVTITCSHAGIETSHLVDILSGENAAQSLKSLWNSEMREVAKNSDSQNTSEMAAMSEARHTSSPKYRLIASADYAEGLSGIVLKLLAFDRFLEERPQWRGHVRLLQIGIALDSRPDDAQRVHKDVTELVETINKRYKEDYPDPLRPAVCYRAVESFPIYERLALWRISSVMLSTCVRSGLDLHPLEYVFCRGSKIRVAEIRDSVSSGIDDEFSQFSAASIDSPGVVILSEFSGCCRVLNGALHINPYSTQSVVNALDRALEMGPEECTDRRRRDILSIYANTKLAWMKRVLSDIVASAKSQDYIYVGTGFGLKYRMLGYGRGFTPLDVETVCRMYRESSRRLILIDYSGTLVEEQSMDKYMKTIQVGGAGAYALGSSNPPGASRSARSGQESLSGKLQSLPPAVEKNLVQLCRSSQNTVYIVSGSDGDALSLALSGLTKQLLNRNTKSLTARSGRLGLAGQHGFVFKPPGAVRWSCLLDDFDAEEANVWQDMALSVMESYKVRTNGAYTWRNAASVGFSYFMTDPEFGRLQASSLTNVLKTTLRAFRVKVVHEAGTVFCAPEGVDKGAFCARIGACNILDGRSSSFQSAQDKIPVGKITSVSQAFDFVLCIGDNISDEHMFEVVNKFDCGASSSNRRNASSSRRNRRANIPEGTNAEGRIFTVTVRPKPSNAKFYVDCVEDVHDVIDNLADIERSKSSSLRKSFSLSSVSTTGSGFVTKAQLMGTGAGVRMRSKHGASNPDSQRRARRKPVYSDVDTRTSRGAPITSPIVQSRKQSSITRNETSKLTKWWQSPFKLGFLWIFVYVMFTRRKWLSWLRHFVSRRM